MSEQFPSSESKGTNSYNEKVKKLQEETKAESERRDREGAVFWQDAIRKYTPSEQQSTQEERQRLQKEKALEQFNAKKQQAEQRLQESLRRMKEDWISRREMYTLGHIIKSAVNSYRSQLDAAIKGFNFDVKLSADLANLSSEEVSLKSNVIDEVNAEKNQLDTWESGRLMQQIEKQEQDFSEYERSITEKINEWEQKINASRNEKKIALAKNQYRLWQQLFQTFNQDKVRVTSAITKSQALLGNTNEDFEMRSARINDTVEEVESIISRTRVSILHLQQLDLAETEKYNAIPELNYDESENLDKFEKSRRILSVDRNASQEQIKAAYKQLAIKYHPDNAPQDKKEEYNLMATEIGTAYQILKE